MGNDEIEIVIFIALVSAGIVLIAIKIIEFFVRFNNDTRYITREMQRADDYNTYRRWRGELRCHYLCLIPFVNDRNVMRLYRRIYHKSKHENKEKRSDGLYHILAPSVISIFICVVCLCGASWAWFTSTQSSSVANIQTATYSVAVTVTKDNTDIAVNKSNGLSDISLEAESEYTITLTAGGTAKVGYCTVDLGGEVYHTPQIKNGESFTFTIVTYQSGNLSITPQWGTCSASETIIKSDEPLEFGTKVVVDDDEPDDNAVIVTPQTTPDMPESTKPTVNTDTETIVTPDTDEPSDNSDITEREQIKEPEETTATDTENE